MGCSRRRSAAAACQATGSAYADGSAKMRPRSASVVDIEVAVTARSSPRSARYGKGSGPPAPAIWHADPSVSDERLTFCRICAAACGMVVTVDGAQVLGVRGDPDHPASRGYTCPKGRALPAFHHAPNRLDRPRVRGRDAAWDEALEDLATGLQQVGADHGADAIGFYLATGLGFDSAGQIASMTWFAAQRSRQLYTAVTVDNAPVLTAAELVTGQPMLNPVWDPDEPGLLLVVGSNPVVSHGYGTAMADPIGHLRRYRAGGGRVWVLDPRRSETAANADRHLAVRPGSDTAGLAWLCREGLDRGADEAEPAGRGDPADVELLRAELSTLTVE